MLLSDNHLVVNLIMLEVLGTILFLVVVTISIYIRRYFLRKSLNGCTALITNGDSKLAQELATHLSLKHNCRVILVKGTQEENGFKSQKIKNTIKSNLNSISGVSMMNCNVLDNGDLEQLSQIIFESSDGIDIVIDNGMMDESVPTDDCQAFIDSTGEKIRATINLLMHFIPKMNNSISGHFVTIQSIKSDKKPVLSSYREINELINHLTDNKPMFEFFGRQKIRLTTVLWNDPSPSTPNSNNNDNCKSQNITDIADQIVDGIRANRNAVHINKRSSIFDFIFKYFSKKMEPNDNSIKF